ncbi:hypothetical protein FRACYDRAFT_251965 [Fragilariopsis cylindrus CCMP1102]|uniref:PTM/DIR17-like Tudor domain-containing protein n=1 Tax=Fragilariopsis cylindrus CCMP1102 TaxID=635003 RepID=A0A1E7EMM8_9STRA|nr:hypothetical protein FRACYDRAFT_251965 [Fragilariopsis cylindrus CCMP1102]|eukprot:OEU07084.1 hypothetical protein FRACYDRAFT_251965 [Fragilariopsis cylindrus CCMP1102]
MAAPTPRVLETAVAAPRVDVNNNNNCNHSPRVAVTTTTTTTDRLQRVLNRLTTKSAPISERSSRKRTKSVRFPENCEGPSALRTKLSRIAEEIVPHTVGTRIRKSFKKTNHNGIISSYDKDREYYMIEYDDGDSEELRHKTVEKHIITANTEIDQLKRLTRSSLQAKSANHKRQAMKMAFNAFNDSDLPLHHAMPVFDEVTSKMLEYRHLINHSDPEIRKQ